MTYKKNVMLQFKWFQIYANMVNVSVFGLYLLWNIVEKTSINLYQHFRQYCCLYYRNINLSRFYSWRDFAIRCPVWLKFNENSEHKSFKDQNWYLATDHISRLEIFKGAHKDIGLGKLVKKRKFGGKTLCNILHCNRWFQDATSSQDFTGKQDNVRIYTKNVRQFFREFQKSSKTPEKFSYFKKWPISIYCKYKTNDVFFLTSI